MALFKPASTPWLLAHELRLAWRGAMSGRKHGAVGSLIAFAALGVMILVGGAFLALAMRGHQGFPSLRCRSRSRPWPWR